MELSDLVGSHMLSGVDELNERIEQYRNCYEDCQVLRFVLDGKTYKATEDPRDGYRSCLRDIAIVDEQVKNNFPAVSVVCSVREKDKFGEVRILEMRDSANSELILEVGTENLDDYYPAFIANWYPEKMDVNKPA